MKKLEVGDVVYGVAYDQIYKFTITSIKDNIAIVEMGGMIIKEFKREYDKNILFMDGKSGYYTYYIECPELKRVYIAQQDKMKLNHTQWYKFSHRFLRKISKLVDEEEKKLK